MSSLSKFFKSKKNDQHDTKAAIQKLRDTLDLLNKKQEFLEKKIDDEIALAKKFGTKNKKMALKALSRKRVYEKQLQQLDGTINTVESQLEALDSAGTNFEVLQSMRGAAAALKGAHKNMSTTDVHNILDEIQEQRAIAEDISNAISTPMDMNLDYDEDELLQELENLEAEAIESQLLDVTPVPVLPSVPDTDLPVPAAAKPAAKAHKNDEDEQMAALAAWSS